MRMIGIIIGTILKILLILIPLLILIAIITVFERKILGSLQRRLGPNKIGIYGMLQPISDAMKLLFKEMIVPLESDKLIFYVAPFLTLVCGLIGWFIIPVNYNVIISQEILGVIYTLAVSSIGIYGILLAGWSANSKYALMGALRSTAQMISYELVLSTIIYLVILIVGAFDYKQIIDSQEYIWMFIPLLPIFIIGIISALAETNRAPFDLPEAESELVAGFMTEHSGSMFVFFFLAEYANIILISTVLIHMFLGGYMFNVSNYNCSNSLILGVKVIFLIYVIIWVRATFPRVRYDQLIKFCWANLLPIVFGWVFILIPLLNVLNCLPINI